MAIPISPPLNISDPTTSEWLERLYLWLTSQEGAAAINYMPSGGSTPVTVQTQLQSLDSDIVSINSTLVSLGLLTTGVKNVLSYGATGDGLNDDADAIQDAVDDVTDGGILYFPAGDYKITDAITVSNPITLLGCGGTASKIKQVTSAKSGFLVTSSNVKAHGLYLYGPQYANFSGTEIGIKAYGASWAAALSNLDFSNNYFANWGYGGIYSKWVSGFRYNRNKIDDVHYTGIAGESIQDGAVCHNRINNIPSSAPVSWNAYGIILSRDEVDSLVTDPRSANIIVTHNRISSIPTWDGLNTHGGDSILFEDNIIRGCWRGISITTCDGETTTYAPSNCHARGNNINSGVTDGSAGPGIEVIGATDGYDPINYALDCSVTDNFIYGHGTDSNAQGGGIVAAVTRGLNIECNRLRYCSSNGIVLSLLNFHTNVNGGTILDTWSENRNVVGVNIYDHYNVSCLIGNIPIADTGVTGATYRVDTAGGIAVSMHNDATNSGKLGLIEGNATTLLSDAGGKITKNLN